MVCCLGFTHSPLRLPRVRPTLPSRRRPHPQPGTQLGQFWARPGLAVGGRAPEAAWPFGARRASAAAGGGRAGEGAFSRDRSARRLSLNLRSDRSIRYFPLLPENSILGLELGPRLNLSGNQRGGDRDRDAGGDRDREIVRDRETERRRDAETDAEGDRQGDSERQPKSWARRDRDAARGEIKSQRDRSWAGRGGHSRWKGRTQ